MFSRNFASFLKETVNEIEIKHHLKSAQKFMKHMKIQFKKQNDSNQSNRQASVTK